MSTCIQRLQRVVDNTVRVLIEFKAKRCVSDSEADAIDELVRDLQKVSREVPNVETRARKYLVYEVAAKAVELWRRLRHLGN